jgi:hypothetical protein
MNDWHYRIYFCLKFFEILLTGTSLRDQIKSPYNCYRLKPHITNLKFLESIHSDTYNKDCEDEKCLGISYWDKKGDGHNYLSDWYASLCVFLKTSDATAILSKNKNVKLNVLITNFSEDPQDDCGITHTGNCKLVCSGIPIRMRANCHYADKCRHHFDYENDEFRLKNKDEFKVCSKLLNKKDITPCDRSLLAAIDSHIRELLSNPAIKNYFLKNRTVLIKNCISTP